MKVSELIAALSALPQDAEVVTDGLDRSAVENIRRPEMLTVTRVGADRRSPLRKSTGSGYGNAPTDLVVCIGPEAEPKLPKGWGFPQRGRD